MELPVSDLNSGMKLYRNERMPLISILMPVHNTQAYLTECLESIACQTFTDFELVAIDDGSVDRSAEILDEWAARDSRSRCLRNETNLGIARTRNRLLAECSSSSRFLALMDADDVCFPDRLERQRAFLEARRCVSVPRYRLDRPRYRIKIRGT